MASIYYTIDFNDTSKTGLSLSFDTFKKISDNTNVLPLPSITELGDGFYRYQFDMDTVDSDIYFVASDGGSNYVTGRMSIENTKEISFDVRRILGLVQENFHFDQQIYDGAGNLTSGRLRIYSDAASVGTSSNIIATYLITATYTSNLLDDYKVVRV